MELYAVKKFGRLCPSDISDAEKMDKMSEGECYRLKVTMPRNIKFHRKFFKMIGVVFENLPKDFAFETPDGQLIKINTSKDLLRHIKYQTGQYDMVLTLGGKWVPELRSIAFDAMDEPEFEEFYNLAVDAVLKYFLVGVKKQDLQEEIIMRFG